MSKLANVWTLSDNVERYVELMSSARLWDGQVRFVVQDNEQANQVKPLGAGEIVILETTSGLQHVGNFAEIIAALIQENTGLLLMSVIKRAKSLGARLSVQLNAVMVNDVISVTPDNGSLFVEYRMYGDLVLGREKTKTTQVIIVLAPGVLEPVETNASYTCPIVSAPYIVSHHEVMYQERRIKSTNSMDPGKAKRVVDMGRGLAAQNDLEMVHQLASVLGTEVGCSRPIAGGEDWMERERYIDVSGVLLKSNFYLTLDISGQIQHMVGGNGAKVIIAINKDREVPIFNYADYGLVGNIYKIVPVLIEHLSR